MSRTNALQEAGVACGHCFDLFEGKSVGCYNGLLVMIRRLTCILLACAASACTPTPRRVPTPGHVLEGRITDASGAAVSGAQVVLFNSLTAEERRSFDEISWSTMICSRCLDLTRFNRHVAATSSDPDGRYRFAGLEPGAYMLRVTAPGLAHSEREVLLGLP